MEARSRKVGIFGGTFDPPHLGHLIVAEQVRDQLGLDEVRFVVANEPWQKEGSRQITAARDRLALTRLAVGGHDGLTVSGIELETGGPSYTIDTLRSLSASEPDVEWFVIVGSDAASGLDTWHEAAELRNAASIVEVNRPANYAGDEDVSHTPAGWTVQRVAVPAIDISSTFIRGQTLAGSSVRFLTPDPVIDLMAELGLYSRQL